MSATSSQNGVNNFIRCHKAIQLVCSQSARLVDSVLQNWHSKHNIPPCSRPRPVPPSNPQECPDRGKPKAGKSCQNCVDWGNAVEAVYYPPWNKNAIQWGNVNPVCLSRSYMDVARAFVLRLQPKQVFNQADNCDTASLLMIMMHFGEFHGNDRKAFDTIKKVFDIRNTLSHLKIEDNLTISDVQIQVYFHDMQELVKCMVHLKHFSQAFGVYIQNELKDIIQSPVTEAITKDVLRPFTDEMEKTVVETIERKYRDHSKELTKHLEAVIREQLQESEQKQTIKLSNVVTESVDKMKEHSRHETAQVERTIHEGFQEVKEQTGRLDESVRGAIAETSETITMKLEAEIRELRQHQESLKEGEERFDVERCKEQLRLEYRTTRGTVPLLPGMPEEFRDMDKLYVDLEIEEAFDTKDSPSSMSQTQCKLKSHHELLNLKNKYGKSVKRVLVKGGPGCGKSTLVSKLAYDYANGNTSSNYELFIVLDLKEIREGMDLADAIQDQLLPKIGRKCLMDYIINHAESVVFLLDGYDEASQAVHTGEFKHLLSNKWLQESLVIVTTRPHMLSNFFQSFGKCNLVNIMNLSFYRICEYVVRYYHLLPYIGCVGHKVGELFDMEYSFTDHSEYVPRQAIHLIQSGLSSAFRNISEYLKINTKVCTEIVGSLLAFMKTTRTKEDETVTQEEHVLELMQNVQCLFVQIWRIYGPPKDYQILTKALSDHVGELVKSLCISKTVGLGSLSVGQIKSSRLSFFHTAVVVRPAEKHKDYGKYLEQAIGFGKNMSIMSEPVFTEKVGQIRSILCELRKHDYRPYEDVSLHLDEISKLLDDATDLRKRWNELQHQAAELTSSFESLNSYWNKQDGIKQRSHDVDLFSGLLHKTYARPPVVEKIITPVVPFLEAFLTLLEKHDQLSRRANQVGYLLKQHLKEAEGLILADVFEELAHHMPYIEHTYNNNTTFLQHFEMSGDVDKLRSEVVKAFMLIDRFENRILKQQQEMSFLAKTILESINSQVDSKLGGHDELRWRISRCMKQFLEHFESHDKATPIQNSLHLLHLFGESFGLSESYSSTIKERIEKVVDLLFLLKSSQSQQLAEIPCLLTMICLLWEEKRQLPDTMTEVYRMALQFLSRHRAAKQQADIDMELIYDDLKILTTEVGQLALEALFQNKLVFQRSEFKSEVVKQACEIGFMSKERRRSKLRLENYVAFVHKSFQEFCAATFLVHLTESNHQQCVEIIRQVNKVNMPELGLFLQFCCGLSHEAAVLIFRKLVDVACETRGKDVEQVIENFRAIGVLMSFDSLGCPRSFNKAYFPLLWLKESKSPDLIQYMTPIVKVTQLQIMFGDDMVAIDSLDSFTDMLLNMPEKNVFETVERVTVSLHLMGGQELKAQNVIAKMLRCLRDVQHLSILADEMKGIRDHNGVIAHTISAMNKLQTILFHGGCDSGYFIDILLEHLIKDKTQFPSLSSVSICVPDMMSKNICKFLKRQRTVSTLAAFSGPTPDTSIFQHNPQKRRQLEKGYGCTWGLSNNRHHVFSGNDTTALLECAASLKSLKTLSLHDSEVPIPPLMPLLYFLEILDLKCPLRFQGWGNPFSNTEFFDAIITVGSQLQKDNSADDSYEHAQYPYPKALPLIVLQLDNGKIPMSAACTLVNACLFLSNLQRLSFGPFSLDEDAVKIFTKALRHLTNLKSLDLGANQIGSSMTELSQGLRYLVNLEELHLNDTDVDDEGLALLPFEWLPRLARLYLATKSVQFCVEIDQVARFVPEHWGVGGVF